MANWWESAPLVEQPQPAAPSGMDWLQQAPLVQQEAAAPTPTAQPRTLTQAATERLRYVNDVLTLGGWDRLQAAARTALGGAPFQQALTEERAATQAARQSLSVPEQIGYGLVGAAPLAATGGVLGLLGRGATAAGAPATGAALTQAATTAAPTLAQRAGIGAAEIGLQGALEAGLRGEDVSTGATTGAAFGAAIPVGLSAVGRAISPIRSQLTEPQKKLAQEAADRGIQLTPAQATGSRSVQFLESQLRDLPGGAMSPRIQQQEQLQRLVLQEAGIPSNYATADALETGFRAAGQKFDEILQGKTVELGKDFTDKVVSSLNRYTDRLDANVKPIFRAQAEGLLREAGAIDGVRAGTIRSDLARLEREYKNQPSLRAALGQLREAVDDAISAALPRAQKQDLRNVRDQYKNLSRLDEIMSRAGPQAESGMIPFVQLNNLIKQSEGSISRGVSAATPEMKKLSQIGATFFREPPSSGTAQRNYINALLTGGIGAGSFMAGGLPGLAAAIGTPFATNLVYNLSPMQRLLSQQAGRALETMTPQVGTAIGTTGLGLLSQ